MRGFCAVGLDNPKNDINVGSAMRAAGCFGAKFVAASGVRFGSGITDTMKTYRHLPLLRPTDIFDVIPYDCVPVAIELLSDAVSLVDYQHPERAYYIFGAEDSTLGKRILTRCRDVVYIPTQGCLNLAATVNVVLYDRLMKNSKVAK
jgi:tRNA(Leu) C34 or U34 (ribose-2'-O)-methylase TrmL